MPISIYIIRIFGRGYNLSGEVELTPPLKAYKVIATGKVQGVGFRRAVQQLARKAGIVGKVKNLDDGNVEILAQGEEGEIDAFLASVRELEAPVKVDELRKAPTRMSSELGSFKIQYGKTPEELEEGLGAGQEQLILMRKDLSSFSSATAGNFNVLANKHDKISEALTILAAQSKQFTDTLTTLTNLAKEYFDERRAVHSSKESKKQS